MSMDERVGASHPQQLKPQLVPVCQWCGADPALFVPCFAQVGAGQVTIFMCANEQCRAVFSMQLTSVQAPPQQSNIIRP